jgi:hypothetical protein
MLFCQDPRCVDDVGVGMEGAQMVSEHPPRVFCPKNRTSDIGVDAWRGWILVLPSNHLEYPTMSYHQRILMHGKRYLTAYPYL